MTDKELWERLHENAEWARCNEWETPLCLADDLTAAADAIERLKSELTQEKIDNTNLIGELATVTAERDRYKAERDGGLADAAFRLSGGGRGGVHMRLAGRQSGRSQADCDVRGRRPHEPRTMPAARLAVHGVFACVRAGRVGERVAALRLGTAYIKLAGDASGKSDSQASRRR